MPSIYALTHDVFQREMRRDISVRLAKTREFTPGVTESRRSSDSWLPSARELESFGLAAH